VPERRQTGQGDLSGFTPPGLDARLAAHGFGVRDRAGVAQLLDRYDPTHASGLAADDWLGVVCAERTGR
jgi:hypothetical protein